MYNMRTLYVGLNTGVAPKAKSSSLQLGAIDSGRK